MTISILNLNSFLKFGYFLDYKNYHYSFDFSGIDKTKYINWTEKELIDEGIKKFMNAIENNFEFNKEHLVPLSGGLDSRAILSGLLEFTEAKNVSTYTFGTPNTWDYDIGNLLAKKIGTNHISFPLTEYDSSMNELIDISKRTDSQTRLFSNPPVWEIDKLFKEFVVWSGFMGDPIAGSHGVDNPKNNTNDAMNYFLNKEAFVKSVNLSNCNNEVFFRFLNIKFINNKRLSFEEQLDFKIRQLKYIAPHVMIKGHTYKLPFIDKEYFNFMLSIPERYRRNTMIYKKILIKAFPNLFKLPTKNNLGLPLGCTDSRLLLRKLKVKLKIKFRKFNQNYINPGINYLDYDYVIRTKENFRTLIYENIMNLKKRKIVDWIDIDNIWKMHMNKKVDYGWQLLVLASLEIHLRAGKILE